MDSSPLLEVKDLTVTFDGRSVVNDVSFTLKPQEVLAVIGPNGSGKSTLLKTLVGINKKYSGSIAFAPGAKIGYLPQRFHVDFYLPMTVREFLDLKPEHKYSLEEVLRLVEIPGNWLDENLATFSSGQLQKILLAFAIIDQPQVLLFDEPTENVDVVSQESIYDLLHELQDKTGVAMVIISHDLNVVYRYAQTVLCLNEKMLCYGPPIEALTNETLSHLYGDHAFFHHHHFGDHHREEGHEHHHE
ncbi:metal ABC transporter ATP-binding protein [Patescibacteria group bacterium]|nr:metal ABC transporter ATP-binding protein [Patescibacteria group bacterium]